jgi:hypothetical protein
MIQQECTICLGQSENYRLHECNHPFCKECITEWIRMGNTTCPNCRGSITEPDYINSDINPRCEVLQKLISNTINYHFEELELLEEDYSETLQILDSDESTYELVYSYHFAKFKKKVESSITKINNELRSVTQDDIDVIESLENKEYYHNLILDNILMNHNEYYMIFESNLERSRSFRKRKREFFKNDYLLKKESVMDSINFLKQI